MLDELHEYYAAKTGFVFCSFLPLLMGEAKVSSTTIMATTHMNP